MLNDFILGLKSYIEAIKFIKKHNFWIYFIFPVLIFIVIYYLGFYFHNLTNEYSPGEDTGFFLSIWYYLIGGIFAVISYMFLNFIRYFIIILMSPLLSIISERTERIITGNKYKFNFKQLMKDVKRALNLVLRNLFWELCIFGLGILIAFYLLSCFTPIDDELNYYIRTFVISIVAFYYYGFGFMDYIMERLRLNLSESVKFVRKHKGFAIALGAVFTPLFHYTNKYLFYLKDEVYTDGNGITFKIILVISAIIMAIVPVVSMVAATIGINKLVDLKNNEFAEKKGKNLDVGK